MAWREWRCRRTATDSFACGRRRATRGGTGASPVNISSHIYDFVTWSNKGALSPASEKWVIDHRMDMAWAAFTTEEGRAFYREWIALKAGAYRKYPHTPGTRVYEVFWEPDLTVPDKKTLVDAAETYDIAATAEGWYIATSQGAQYFSRKNPGRCARRVGGLAHVTAMAAHEEISTPSLQLMNLLHQKMQTKGSVFTMDAEHVMHRVDSQGFVVDGLRLTEVTRVAAKTLVEAMEEAFPNAADDFLEFVKTAASVAEKRRLDEKIVNCIQEAGVIMADW